MKELDDVFGDEEPLATFHDARLLSVAVNYEDHELVAEWSILVGDLDAKDITARERTRRGRLVLRGLAFWVIDPPTEVSGSGRPWLTGDGPICDAKTPTAKQLEPLVCEGLFARYLYFSNTNSFAYFAAREVEFTWHPSE